MSKLSSLTPDLLLGNPRATLEAWLRYQPLVLDAYANRPNVFTFTPTDMSASTVCSRIRDAIRGKFVFDYPCTVDTASLLSWWTTVVVRHTSTSVFIGPRETIQPSVAYTLSSPKSREDYAFSTVTIEELLSLALLLNNARITGPIAITRPPSFDLDLLTARFLNVELIHRPDGTLLLI